MSIPYTKELSAAGKTRLDSEAFRDDMEDNSIAHYLANYDTNGETIFNIIESDIATSSK